MVLMDDTEDDVRYPPNPYDQNQNNLSLFPPSNRSMVTIHSAGASPQTDRRYPKEEADVESDADLNDGNQANDDDVEEDDDDVEEDDDDGEEEEDNVGVSDYCRAREEDESSPDSRGKRRKLDKFASGFELVPRAAPPPTPVPSSVAMPSKPPARNNPADWTEDSTFVLLDAWGVLYVKNGRKSLRSDEWMEVAKKVNDAARNPRTDAQCRNRIDTLKKKYKKEKVRMAESICSDSRWVYFKKMEQLMGLPTPLPLHVTPLRQRQKPRLPRGVGSGEYGFKNSRHYPSRLNSLNSTRDSAVGPELKSDDEDNDDSDGLPPQSNKKSSGDPNSSSFKMLIDSINKFSMVHEKIENSKRKHMLELKKMRKKYQRELELQNRQILERALEELEKLRQEEGYNDEESEDVDEENNDNEDIDCSGSAENGSS